MSDAAREPEALRWAFGRAETEPHGGTPMEVWLLCRFNEGVEVLAEHRLPRALVEAIARRAQPAPSAVEAARMWWESLPDVTADVGELLDSLAALLDRHAAAQSAALARRLRGLVEQWQHDAYVNLNAAAPNTGLTLQECAKQLAAALQEPPQ